MSRVLVEMQGSVVNGADHGNVEAAQAEVSRLLRERANVDPARAASLPFLELFEVVLARTVPAGGWQLLAADPRGQWARVSEHADVGSARAALVRLVREHAKGLAVARFDEAVARLERQGAAHRVRRG